MCHTEALSVLRVKMAILSRRISCRNVKTLSGERKGLVHEFSQESKSGVRSENMGSQTSPKWALKACSSKRQLGGIRWTSLSLTGEQRRRVIHMRVSFQFKMVILPSLWFLNCSGVGQLSHGLLSQNVFFVLSRSFSGFFVHCFPHRR